MNEILEVEKPIKIHMLGRFSFEYDGQILLEDEGKIHKVWMLLGYLLANHNRTIVAAELTELLCGDERSDNPTKAVKNLIYRLRCLLSDSGLPQWNYIIQTGGVYNWNSELNFILDTDEFTKAYSKAKKLDYNDEDAIKAYIEAIDTYKGKFLPYSIYDEWAVSATVYYHRLYIDSIKNLYILLEKSGDFETILPICERAISIDNQDEDIYKIYIHCLAKRGRHREALKAYETITDKLYDELGVNPSKELRELYREIIKTIKSVETDLMTIKADLNESGATEYCYFCEYHIFKDIYRFIARRISRTGESIYVMLCTLTDKGGDLLEAKSLSESMSTLKAVIGKSLRKADIYARYSNSQFVVLLLDTSYEDGLQVGKRIENVFKSYKIGETAMLNYKLQPLDTNEF